jgi:RHS repeat-associated protein
MATTLKQENNGGNKQESANEAGTTDNSSKSGSAAVQAPSITLPKGGGAIKSVDEKFSVNPVNGSAAFSIPFPLSPSRNEFAPALSLNYSSGGGNGPFGLGWSADFPSIFRRTEKQLPQYEDASNSDIFIYSGEEDLIPAYSDDGLGNWTKEETTLAGDLISRYRPRTESRFSRIERIKEASGNVYWRTITKDNITSHFGKSSGARIADPQDPGRIFKWLLEFSHDDKGNCYSVEYKSENLDRVDTALQEQNRLNGLTKIANTYIKKIKYGNRESYLKNTNPDYLLEAVLDYGEHDLLNPQPDDAGLWSCRKDPFSNYRSGFEIRCYRSCSRILMFHLFPELGGTPCLVRSINLDYDTTETFTFLKSFIEFGFIRQADGSYISKPLPPVQFEYQAPGWNTDVKSISTANTENAPAGIDDKSYKWSDLYGEGVSGILSEQAGSILYKSNLGQGVFSPARILSHKPSFSGIASGEGQLQELEANGKKFYVSHEAKGFFELNAEDEWLPFRNFESIPNISWSDPNLKMLDLNGDGLADVLITEDDVFTWYAAEGKGGYSPARKQARAFDEEKGPAIIFSDQVQSIVLADMSGDGLLDIVRIRSAEVVYWPNLGYGKFGAKAAMANVPVFDQPDAFNPSFIKLADIDGSGTTDIIYLGKNNFSVCFNQSGNSFSSPKTITHFPAIHNAGNFSFIDLLGNGTNCLTWSSPLPSDASTTLRYIDLMNGRKPHLLTGYRNNLGKELNLSYTPSTSFYLADKKAGKPWITKLPFPVHCVSQIEIIDRITRTRFTNQYTYHHGFYDYSEREFRGFGMVEQTDSDNFEVYVTKIDPNGSQSFDEQTYQQPTLTKTWFHTGAFLNEKKILHHNSTEYYQNPAEHQIQEPGLPVNLSPEERREALRACKGIPLRVEVYARDGSAFESTPYTTRQHNCLIQLVQPQLKNKYASFFMHESEVLSYNYERLESNPRIKHVINTEIDKYGNVLQSAAVGYGRKNNDSDLDPDDQQNQGKIHILYTRNTYSNAIDAPTDYRLPVLTEVQTYELTDAPPEADGFYVLDKIKTSFQTAAEINYENNPTSGILQKRLVEHIRTYFLRDDLSGILALHVIQSKALLCNSIKLAFTPSLLTARYGGKVTDLMLTDSLQGAYVHSELDANYWIPSPTQTYDPDHYYQVVALTDPFGNTSTAVYDSPYHFFLSKTSSPLILGTNNITEVLGYNYRTLQPYLSRDVNDNLSAVRFDEFGKVIATFRMGKEGESKGDRFDETSSESSPADKPGTMLDYATDNWYKQTLLPGFDLTNYKPKPNCVKLTAVEEHYFDNPSPKTQLSFTYSDGSGHEVMKKIQAEPGDVPLPGGAVTHNVNPRWVGNGRTIMNNKGKPVKQFEPFFSITSDFEDDKDLVEGGVTPILYYDPLGRMIRTDFADGTRSSIEFDAWKQITSDRNDTVLLSSWYTSLSSPDPTGPEPADKSIRAAWLSAITANTPSTVYLDSLGRTFLSIQFNRSFKIDPVTKKASAITDILYKNRTLLDIEDNPLQLQDARGNMVMENAYDMLGQKVYQHSMDGAERWSLNEAAGKPLRSWDSKKHAFRYEYDTLRRPSNSFVSTNGNPEINFEKIIYGESQPGGKMLNLRNQPFNQYDAAGLIVFISYDFKGNLLASSRQLASDYINDNNWSGGALMESELFNSSSTFDALNRPTTVTTPDTSILRPIYNKANLLAAITVNLQGDPGKTNFIKNIDYNEKGQRSAIIYGNGVKTRYDYDKKSFRLIHLYTTGKNGTDQISDLSYNFDAMGNVTSVTDAAQESIYFNNAVVNPSADYVYDAIYKLTAASGREHTGQNKVPGPFDEYRTDLAQPGDGTAMRNYSQQYLYDAAGNMMQMIHAAGAGSWTRNFSYESLNNRLKNSDVGGLTENYVYDTNGNMTFMPHLPLMEWSFKDELQHADLGGGGQVYYTYDKNGQRVRKVNVLQGGLIRERIYLGNYELYRESSNGNPGIERQTLHIMDDKSRIALVETRTKGKDDAPPQLIRYQMSNHLETSCVELDQLGNIISYEEYHPFGTTAYQAMNKVLLAKFKRYRFTGKERDEETGLYYHGARYYVCWLARWASPDPIGTGDGLNLYAYVKNNPAGITDKKGTDGTKPWTLDPATPGRGPDYQSTGDQVKTDSGKVGKAALGIAADSPLAKEAKKLYLDPEIAKLGKELETDWNKDKAGKATMIVGGTLIFLPTIGVLTYLSIKNPKLDVPIVGDFYPRTAGVGLLSLGVGALTEKLSGDRFKLGLSYENKSGRDVYGAEIKIGKSPTTLTVGGKAGGGYEEGSVKVEDTKGAFKYSAGVTGKTDSTTGVSTFSTSVVVDTKIAGIPFKFTGLGFSAPTTTTASPFDVKYDDTKKTLTVLPGYVPVGKGVFFTVDAKF